MVLKGVDSYGSSYVPTDQTVGGLSYFEWLDEVGIKRAEYDMMKAEPKSVLVAAFMNSQGVAAGGFSGKESRLKLQEMEEYSTQGEEVYNSLLTGTYEEDDVWSLPKGGTFPLEYGTRAKPGFDRLFVRDSWKHLVELMSHVADGKTIDGVYYSGALVSGPPGDGKSHLALYFLKCLLGSGHTVVYEIAGQHEVWVLGGDGVVKRRMKIWDADMPELRKKGTVHIYDASTIDNARPPMMSPAPLFVFSTTSNGKAAFKQIIADGKLLLTHITPEREEVIRACEVFQVPDPAEVLRRYGLYGGTLRSQFRLDGESAERYIHDCAMSVPLDNLGSMFANNYKHSSGSRGDKVVPSGVFSTFLRPQHMVKLAAMESSVPAESPEQRVRILYGAYRESSVVWRVSSGHTKKLLEHYSKIKGVEFIKVYVEATKKIHSLGTARGNALEMVYGALLAEGGRFMVRELRPAGGVATASEVAEQVFPPRELKTVEPKDMWREIQQCRDGVLLSVCRNYPGYDAYGSHDSIFQVTTRLRHPITFEPVARLCELLRETHKTSNPRLYFLLPKDERFDNWFCEQKWCVQQTEITVTASDDAKNRMLVCQGVHMGNLLEFSAGAGAAERSGIAAEDKTTTVTVRLEADRVVIFHGNSIVGNFMNGAALSTAKNSRSVSVAVGGRTLYISLREMANKEVSTAELPASQRARIAGLRQYVMGVDLIGVDSSLDEKDLEGR